MKLWRRRKNWAELSQPVLQLVEERRCACPPGVRFMGCLAFAEHHLSDDTDLVQQWVDDGKALGDLPIRVYRISRPLTPRGKRA